MSPNQKSPSLSVWPSSNSSRCYVNVNTGYTKNWPIRLDQISRPRDCLYWAGVTIMHQTKATARNEKNQNKYRNKN